MQTQIRQKFRHEAQCAIDLLRVVDCDGDGHRAERDFAHFDVCGVLEVKGREAVGAAWGELIEKQGAIRAKYVCDRFKSEFKYEHVYPFPIYEKKDKGGRIMYYMIHASDHPEASTLMYRAYGKALDIKESDQQLELLRDLISQGPKT
jgi:hypothetical protein